ncbi:hypothetical protein [Bacteroides neonati]|uniref:hypothetical protein n=1 Tax=Bacteroides neonati TaxID=1347393 RepID=UPI00069354CE|nr:hypothetical protein [Bacteroides neonati]
MDSIFSRIKLYIAHLGISNNEFGRNIDCSSAQITQMLTYEKNFGIDKLLKIISRYPNLNCDWLLTGKGSMLRNKKEESTSEHISQNTQPDSSIQESFIYNMYKEEKAENKLLIEEIGALKLKISQLEAGSLKGKTTAKTASTKNASSQKIENVDSASAR